MIAARSVTSATVNLTGLDVDREQAAIEVGVTGPIRDAMSVIDTKPFEYAKEIGVDPARTGGTTEAHLSFRFPLVRDLKFEQVGSKGTIYAYTIMHHTGDKRFAAAVPYASIIVELDDAPGALLAGNLLGSSYTEAKVGRRVEVVFEKVNDDITLPQFRLAR